MARTPRLTADVRALEALERNDEAQDVRWRFFEKTLNPDYLRAYLKRLPDFEDFEAEQKGWPGRRATSQQREPASGACGFVTAPATAACHDGEVLFVDLPFNTYELGRKFKSAWQFKQYLRPPELHLGFRYMVSALRAQGHAANIVFPTETAGARWKSHLVKVIAARRPLLLGFRSYEGSLKELVGFIASLKRAGVASTICIGGHLATFSYAEILRDFHDLIDVVVLGEGERAIVEIAEALKSRRGFAHIRGIAYHDGERMIETAARPIERAIDQLPFPVVPCAASWRDEPLFVTTSRGCYGRCSFCRSSHFGERWRARDPISVVDEIEQAVQLGIKTFEFVDDNFLGPGRAGKRRARAVADEIMRRNLRIAFHASCRVNDVEEATMVALKNAGLISVSLGVESGVQRILDTFNKNTTVEQNVAALELLDRLEISTLAYIIFFDPYMTLDEARENLDFLVRVRRWKHVRFERIIFRKLIPISGTDLFERLRRDGLLRGDYLQGYRFVFKDKRVAVLSDFMESVDLRFERLLQNEAIRRIEGLYGCMESLEYFIARKAVEFLSCGGWHPPHALAELNRLVADELGAALEGSPAAPPRMGAA